MILMSKNSRPDRSGDQRSAEFLRAFLNSEHRIRSYIRVLIFDRVSAEDIFQDVSVTMLEKYESLDPETDFTAWACRIAWFKVLEWRQRQARDRLRFSEATLQQVADEAMANTAESDRRQEALEKCVEKLSPDNIQMLIFRYQNGEAVEAIANKMDRTDEAVYKALSRIRRSLHDCINRVLSTEGNAR